MPLRGEIHSFDETVLIIYRPHRTSEIEGIIKVTKLRQEGHHRVATK